MNRLLVTFKNAVASVRSHPELLALAVLVDVLFLISFGFVYGVVFADTAAHLDALNTILAEQTAQFVNTQDASALVSNPDIDMHYTGVLRGIALMLLALYVLWSLSQGINWWIAHRMEGRTTSFWPTLGLSFAINIVWLLVFTAILAGIAWLSQQSLLSPVPLIGPGAFEVATFVLIAVLHYFMTVSYACITHTRPVRMSLHCAVNNGRYFAPMFLVGATGIIAAGFLILQLSPINYMAGIAILLLVMLPWLALSRTWMSTLAHAK